MTINKMTFTKNLYKFLLSISFLMPAVLFAGNISASSNMAWGDRLGWVNFSTDNGNVVVTDTMLTGYAWSSNYGWINLSPDNGGVVNDGSGNLSGYAWGEKLGWVNFSGVSINPSNGYFAGHTVNNALAGTINFSCDHCSVITSWRKNTIYTSTQNTNSSGSRSGSRVISHSSTTRQTVNIIDGLASIPKKIFDKIIPDFLKTKKIDEESIDIEEYIRNTSPLVMKGKWNIFPHKYSDMYVLAPLPKEIRNLAIKFPQLKSILKDVGVSKITDLDKLRNSKINLPHVVDVINLPSEVVVAGNGLLNMVSSIQLTDKGEVEQKIQTIVNKTIKLSVRPISGAESVIGYLAFNSRTRNVSVALPPDSLFASAILAVMPEANKDMKMNKIEEKMVVSTFDYSDPDGDGVYTAEITAPQTEGEYEVITLIKYIDPSLGTKEMRLITLVDPEGYVFERSGNLETRISDVKITIYKDSNLWDAKKYNQENPQITDKTGKYSFLVPEGDYFIIAEARGYDPYKSEKFSVVEGKGIHFNIEMKRNNSWINDLLDWRTILIVLMGGALIFSFWNEHKMFKKLLDK